MRLCAEAENSKDRNKVTSAQTEMMNYATVKKRSMMTRHLQEMRKVVIEMEENDVNILSGHKKAHLITYSFFPRLSSRDNISSSS